MLGASVTTRDEASRALNENIDKITVMLSDHALECAAIIADNQEGYPTLTIGECGCGESIAEKIRALKGKHPRDWELT